MISSASADAISGPESPLPRPAIGVEKGVVVMAAAQ